MMTENDKKLAEYTNEELIDLVKNGAMDYIKEEIQKELVSRGFGRDTAEAMLDFIRAENSTMNYDKILADIPEDNALFAQLAGLDIFEQIENIENLQSLIADVLEISSTLSKLQASIDAGENLDPDDVRDMMEFMLKKTADAIEFIVPTGFFFDYIVGETIDYFIDGYNTIANYSEIKGNINDFSNKYNVTVAYPDDIWNIKSTGTDYLGNGRTLGDAIMNLIDTMEKTEGNNELGFPEDGPTIADLALIYEKIPDAKNYFEEYAEWRLAYEFNNQFTDNEKAREYLESLDAFGSKIQPTFWTKLETTFSFFGSKQEITIKSATLSNELISIPGTANELKAAIGETDEEIKQMTSSENAEKIRKTFWQAIVDKAVDAMNNFVIAQKTISPIVLDLAGDGFETVGQAKGTYFDLDNNGFAEKTAWISGSDDGFLTLDLNRNGKIDDGGELFGNYTKLENGENAKDGFAALAQYDSNADGVINSLDEIFGDLRIWIDNGNGKSETGELKTLSEAGVESISLNQTETNITYNDSYISGISQTILSDGTSINAADFWFNTSKIDTEYVENSGEYAYINGLPNVRAIGSVPSLHEAMRLDKSGKLAELVKSFAESSDKNEKQKILKEILYKMTGADSVSADSRGKFVDAKDLFVVETLLNKKYDGSPEPNAAAMIKMSYNELFGLYYTSMTFGDYEKFLQTIRFTEENGVTKFDTSLFDLVMKYAEIDDKSEIISGVAKILKVINADDYAQFMNKYIAISDEYIDCFENNDVISVTSTAAVYGYAGDDIIEDKNNVNAVIIGGKGDDLIYGDGGNDTYIFNSGDGNDTIDEYHYSSNDTRNDRIIFGEGITADDIKIQKIGTDMKVFIGENDSITINDCYGNTQHQIEYFEFADGTVWNSDKIFNRKNLVYGTNNSETLIAYKTGTGFEFDPTLRGYGGADLIEDQSGGNATIIGGTGNDTMYGDGGNDTYIFNLGDGNDYIDEYHYKSDNAKNDKIVFGAGINAKDLSFKRSGTNLIIGINANDSITIEGHFFNDYHQIEYFEFADGTVLGINDIKAKTNWINGTNNSETIKAYTDGISYNFNQTLRGYGGNDTIEDQSGGNATFIGGTGNDTMYGEGGNDTYIFNLGDGNDYIDEYHYKSDNAKNDKIVFGAGIKSTDAHYRRLGTNLKIEINENDSITIEGYFFNDYHQIEYFEFEDKTIGVSNIAAITWGINGTDNNDTIKAFTDGISFNFNQTLRGYGGADTITGFTGNDIIDGGSGNDTITADQGNDKITGGTGNDTISGGRGNDTYIFNIGDGKDVITDYNEGYTDKDKIVFGEGINTDDLIFSKNGYDLNIGIAGTTDEITVKYHFYNNNYKVENIQTFDNSLITYTNINSLIQAMAEFTTDTGMTASEAAQENNQTYSDIINQMWVNA
jgi:Ca2+-binding RTX toxin-like protein